MPQFRPFPRQQKRDKWGEFGQQLQSIIPLLTQAMKFSQDQKKQEAAEARRGVTEGRADLTFEQQQADRAQRIADRPQALADKAQTRASKQERLNQSRAKFQQWKADQNKAPGDQFSEAREKTVQSGVGKFFGAQDPEKQASLFDTFAPQAQAGGYAPTIPTGEVPPGFWAGLGGAQPEIGPIGSPTFAPAPSFVPGGTQTRPSQPGIPVTGGQQAPQLSTPEEVKTAFQAGQIDRETARGLIQQFGR